MLRTLSYAAFIIATFLFVGCIDFYKAAPEEAMRTLLVIDGDITDDTTVIYLSQSVPISNYQLDVTGFPKVNDARVRVERSDGVFFDALADVEEGEYKIATGDLDPDLEYRLNVEHGGNTYLSAYAFPLRTPEIDEVIIDQYDSIGRFDEFNIYISVALSDPDDGSPYYKWRCDEIYEYHSRYRADIWFAEDATDADKRNMRKLEFPDPANGIYPPYYCWKYTTTYHRGNFEKLAGDKYFKTLVPVSRLSDKLSELYYLKINQYRISREASEYYEFLFKNSRDIGTVFSPIPSEVNGNIRCENNHDIPVIGYINVSKTTFTELFVAYPNEYYIKEDISFNDICDSTLRQRYCIENCMSEDPENPPIYVYPDECARHLNNLSDIDRRVALAKFKWAWANATNPPVLLWKPNPYPEHGETLDNCNVIYQAPLYGGGTNYMWAASACVDCRWQGGVRRRPEWWPNDHY